MNLVKDNSLVLHQLGWQANPLGTIMLKTRQAPLSTWVAARTPRWSWVVDSLLRQGMQCYKAP